MRFEDLNISTAGRADECEVAVVEGTAFLAVKATIRTVGPIMDDQRPLLTA